MERIISWYFFNADLLACFVRASPSPKDKYPSLSSQAKSRANTIEKNSSVTKLIQNINYTKNDSELTFINVNPELQKIINKKNEPSPNGWADIPWRESW